MSIFNLTNTTADKIRKAQEREQAALQKTEAAIIEAHKALDAAIAAAKDTAPIIAEIGRLEGETRVRQAAISRISTEHVEAVQMERQASRGKALTEYRKTAEKRLDDIEAKAQELADQIREVLKTATTLNAEIENVDADAPEGARSVRPIVFDVGRFFASMNAEGLTSSRTEAMAAALAEFESNSRSLRTGVLAAIESAQRSNAGGEPILTAPRRNFDVLDGRPVNSHGQTIDADGQVIRAHAAVL